LKCTRYAGERVKIFEMKGLRDKILKTKALFLLENI